MRWDVPARSARQEKRGKSPFLCLLSLIWLDDAHPHQGGQSALPTPKLHRSQSSCHLETPSQTHPEIMFNPGTPWPIWHIKLTIRASLVAQWLRICLPRQGTWVQALVQEDPTHRRATKPVCLRSRACEPHLLKPACLESVLCNKRSHHNEKPAHRNKE